MIPKEHPLKKTATEIRRSKMRLETYINLNPQEAAIKNVKPIVDQLSHVYSLIPKEFRKKD
jgi:DNA-directed RNA polymerase subunit L